MRESNLVLAWASKAAQFIGMTGCTGLTSEVAATHRALATARARLAARDDAILRTQIAVAQIAAPTGEEHERARWVERRFRDCGLSALHTDDAGNVIGRREGTV